jgi:hypothetical protein
MKRFAEGFADAHHFACGLHLGAKNGYLHQRLYEGNTASLHTEMGGLTSFVTHRRQRLSGHTAHATFASLNSSRLADKWHGSGCEG